MCYLLDKRDVSRLKNEVRPWLSVPSPAWDMADMLAASLLPLVGIVDLSFTVPPWNVLRLATALWKRLPGTGDAAVDDLLLGAKADVVDGVL